VKYVGIDVHKKMCQVAVLDDEGELLDETRFMNTPKGIEEFAQRLSVYGDEVRAVVESPENLWIQVHDRLEEHSIDVALSSPANSRLVSESRVKTDRTTLGPSSGARAGPRMVA